MIAIELPPPARMTATARANEIATILASALIRTHATLQPEKREIPLGFLPQRSVHTNPYPEEKL